MKPTIGVLLVSTFKYHVFLQPLIDGIDKHFFKGHNIEVYLFTDRDNTLRHSSRINIVQIPIEHKPFPYPTLMRYSFFSKAEDVINASYLFYLDVDMAIVAPVGEEILPDGINDEGLVATLHPGFYNGGGSWEKRPESKAYIPEENRKLYYCGGFNGGETKAFLKMAKELADDIADDEKRGIIAVWNDESHTNRYFSTRTPKTLTPEYCLVEEISKRKLWGINHFSPKIIAIAKEHDKIRY